jgi:2-keto-3-deoxygluconate permease
MRIKKAIELVPGGLMVVPLLLGALLSTLDQQHFAPVQAALKAVEAKPSGYVMKLNPETGAPERVPVIDEKTGQPKTRPVIDKDTFKPVIDPQTGQPKLEIVYERTYEVLQMGGFFSALFSKAAIGTLIALFLFCAGSQMNLRVGGRAMKKGLLITTAKYGAGLAVAAIFAVVSDDPMNGVLGLSVLVIIAAMTNSNGGMYVALTGEYGNKSDVGAVAVLSLNDGPLFTLFGLALFGATGLLADTSFPISAFLVVFLPIGIGMFLGNLDEDIRKFLEPGQTITIPFFAFALGTLMNLSVFTQMDVLLGGLALGLATVILTGLAGAFALALFGERSQVAGISEASTAGNAVQTPAAIGVAAATAIVGGAGLAAEQIEALSVFADKAFVKTATAQVSISTLSTALMCPFFVIVWNAIQKARGIDGTKEHMAGGWLFGLMKPFRPVGEDPETPEGKEA